MRIERGPALEANRAIIKVKRIGICGTDLHAFEGTQPFFEYPRILGHELSGELVEFDNAPGFEKGERVSVHSLFQLRELYCLSLRIA
jgi:threonine dehydrogenase-like Zn-dependent dehydrogenase